MTTINFAGLTWDVSEYGNFTADPGSVYVDIEGKLHVKVRQVNGSWKDCEVVGQKYIGYGTYKFVIDSDMTNLDPNLVLGLFSFFNNPATNQEVDIEFAHFFNNPLSNVGFTVQPGPATEVNQKSWTIAEKGKTCHVFNWGPFGIDFASYAGEDTNGQQLQYFHTDLKRDPTNVRAIINFWQFAGKAPAQETEVIISDFQYIPLGGISDRIKDDSMWCNRLREAYKATYTGPAGRGVSSVTIDANSHLILTMTDSTTIDAGLIPSTALEGKSISSATVNGSGHLILTMSDATTIDAGYVVGPTGATGATGPQGPAGTSGGSSQGQTFIASEYATAQDAIDAAKGHLLILDKTFYVSTPLRLNSAEYNGTVIIGTDQLSTGLRANAGMGYEGVMDIRASNVICQRFTIDGANFPNTTGLDIGDRQTNTTQAKKCSFSDIIIMRTTMSCIRFYDQVDYIDFYNIRAVDENVGMGIYIDSSANTIYDNGNVRFFGCFFSATGKGIYRNAVSGTFHRLGFFGCQWNGSNNADIQIDLSNIHECTFIGCNQETSGGAPSQCMLKISGYNQTFIDHTISGNGTHPGTCVVYLDGGYNPYMVYGFAIENWDNTTLGIDASAPTRLKGGEDTIFVGAIGTKFGSNVIVGQDKYGPSATPTLVANGDSGTYFDGTNYYFAAMINGVVKKVQLT